MKLRDVTGDRFDLDFITTADRAAVRCMFRAFLWVSGDIARHEAIGLAVTLDNMRCALRDGKL